MDFSSLHLQSLPSSLPGQAPRAGLTHQWEMEAWREDVALGSARQIRVLAAHSSLSSAITKAMLYEPYL